jgi:PAS domain S-box-containing protein
MTDTAQAGAGTLRTARRLVWWMVVPVVLLLVVLTLLQYHQRMVDTERELRRRADERAQELEAIARPAAAHVHDLRRLLELHWHAPPDSGPEMAQALALREVQGRPDGWSLDNAPAEFRRRWGQVWWASPPGSETLPPEPQWLRRATMFLRAARVVHERTPGFEATWFAGGEANVSFGYPWVDTTRMLGSMGLPGLQSLDEKRAAGVQRAEADLARDPKDISFWGLPYVSQLNGELVQSHGAMVVVDGRYRGEVSLDFRLDALQRIARTWQDASPEERTRVWVAGRQLHVLADAADPLRRPSGEGLADTQVALPLDMRLPLMLAPTQVAELKGLGGTEADSRAPVGSPESSGARTALFESDGWVLVAAGRAGSPWLYVQAVPRASLRAMVLPTLLPNLVLLVALAAVFVAGQWLFARWFVQPALAVLTYLRQLSTDPATPAPQLGERWRGWVDAVSDTFAVQRTLQQRERAHETFKSAMVDHAPVAIITTGGPAGEGRIVEFNPAAEAMFGVPREEALGRDMAEVVLPEAARAERRRLGFGDAPTTGRHASGREFPMRLLTFRVHMDGQPFDTAFITDLSAERQATLQIERQRDALRQSEKLSAMGSLLAGVAHELNNPLAIVMGRASLLEEKAGDSALEDDARRIREAAERCGRIVRTFLNMARQKPPERHAVALNDIVQAAADMLGYTLRSHGISVKLQLAADMPVVQADADQLGQVVLNLMVNAQQAMAGVSGSAGLRELQISTGVEAPRPDRPQREPRVWLRVADSGPGVSAAVRERLFEPFFTTKAAGFGTGLGLSVSRSIVREHGGELMLESRPASEGPGASFRLSLPISGEAAPTSVSAPLDTTGGEPQARVLVVDDEAEIAELMRTVLESAGYDVATAESGAVALELLAEARFDAIVSDVRMPDIDGAALWHAVRELHPLLATRMLFVSGDTLSQEARQVLEATRCPSLDKPFANADLLGALRALIDT